MRQPVGIARARGRSLCRVDRQRILRACTSWRSQTSASNSSLRIWLILPAIGGVLTPVIGKSFEGAIGLAKGGLANGRGGAGVYCFNDRDLNGFPIRAADLHPFYDELTARIGLSGANDALAGYFGHGEGLQPPLRLGESFDDMMRRYDAMRPLFERERGLLGRSRVHLLPLGPQRRS